MRSVTACDEGKQPLRKVSWYFSSGAAVGVTITSFWTSTVWTMVWTIFWGSAVMTTTWVWTTAAGAAGALPQAATISTRPTTSMIRFSAPGMMIIRDISDPPLD